MSALQVQRVGFRFHATLLPYYEPREAFPSTSVDGILRTRYEVTIWDVSYGTIT